MGNIKPFRVLTIDGGGMRGLYTATYLETLSRRFNDNRVLDIGRAFDLIVGTSTGGILACGLAAAISTDEISTLYREHGEAIFPRPTPELSKSILNFGWKLRKWEKTRADWAIAGQAALKNALENIFGSLTIGQVWDSRKTALCIPTVNMSNHKPWVFKTPHLPGKTRDNEYQLMDVCLATAAAPIFFPLAVTDVPNADGYNVFCDGGLWANNPVMIGMVEALQIAEPDRPIEIISIGTCQPPSGRVIKKDENNWGLLKWRAGTEIVSTALDAQSAGYDFIAAQIAPNLNRPCKFVRLPSNAPSGEQAAYVALDKADENACKVLTDLGRSDAEAAHSRAMQGDAELEIVRDAFSNLEDFT